MSEQFQETGNIWRIGAADTYAYLGSRAAGLSGGEVEASRAAHGANELAAVRRRPLIWKFLAGFYHLMALLLWAASALAFIAGETELGWTIVAVIVINAVFSFSQEFKAEKATDALGKMVPETATVIRGGEVGRIFARELVIGDVVIVEEGDKVSADSRLVEEREVRVDNSTLTGESEPVRRSADAFIESDVALTDVPNLIFAGTSIAFGRGKAVVYAVGMETQFGKIAALTQELAPEKSPLQLQIDRAVRTMALIALFLGFLLFLAGSQLGGLDPAKSLTFAIGMIVANVPEGLLPTVTLALAVGVQRLAARRALVKKLSAVETLGSTAVICTDKTGTLTQNEMTVREVWAGYQGWHVEGVGYDPRGGFVTVGRERAKSGTGSSRAGAENAPVLRAALEAAAYCNNARILPPDDGSEDWRIVGDPTEAAMLVAAAKGGVDISSDGPRLYELPFESTRKRMSVIYAESGSLTAYVKGAPNVVLDLSDRIAEDGEVRELTATDRLAISSVNDGFAADALRVIALAKRSLPLSTADITPENVETGLIFLGLMAMMDPPRPEVEAAVSECRGAGVRAVMITGDYGLTAESVARRIGLVGTEDLRVITGPELEILSDEELRALLGEDREVLFARVSPEHKMRVAQAYRAIGWTVAMTGDGVNDAPALKKADIGVAMGRTGTDVAKEAAEMIVTDDNFATIVDAVEEGRVVFDNMRKFINYIFAHLTPEVVPFVLFVLLQDINFPLGITVLQILAIDLGTETVPALALGVEPPEPGIMSRPPRGKKENLLNREILIRSYVWLGMIEAVLVMAAFISVLYRGGWVPGTPDISDPGSPAHGLYLEATTMTFLGIVAAQIGTVFASRTHRASVFAVGLFSNRWVLVGIVFELVVAALLMYVPLFAGFFGMAPLGPLEWAVALTFAPIILFADEGRKALLRRREARRVVESVEEGQSGTRGEKKAA